jgi:hypothetical protein
VVVYRVVFLVEEDDDVTGGDAGLLVSLARKHDLLLVLHSCATRRDQPSDQTTHHTHTHTHNATRGVTRGERAGTLVHKDLQDLAFLYHLEPRTLFTSVPLPDHLPLATAIGASASTRHTTHTTRRE